MIYLGIPAWARECEQIENWSGLGPARAARLVQFGPMSFYYWNCDKYVAAYGGNVIYGWQIVAVPGLFAKALHHAVVEAEDGSLVDPTDPYGVHTGETTILLDNSLQPARDYPPLYSNKYLPFSEQGANACRLVRDAEEDQLEICRRLNAIAKSQGIEWSPEEYRGPDLTEEVHFLHDAYAETQQRISAAYDFCRSILDANKSS
ncbi:hypothetical protein [Sphingomonas sp.]|uniref:hypothetical protein n=1 Tax=Sphingomonas sp. TaxID=28214 RepID=UPI001B1EFC04|nr:hypothetical protein [Sphingomonas sp.]MBO9714929.1 hypothetical protein [Sphingomonas sp.]